VWPAFHVRSGVRFTFFAEFDGISRNYDGIGHNANDNSTFRVFPRSIYQWPKRWTPWRPQTAVKCESPGGQTPAPDPAGPTIPVDLPRRSTRGR
jgi:hypothetical protein